MTDNRTFCKKYGTEDLWDREEEEKGKGNMPEDKLQLHRYREDVLQKQRYYDWGSHPVCVSYIEDGKMLVPAGTSIYSMSVKEKNAAYQHLRTAYDVAFLFDDMSAAPAFYSVPRFDIMAVDSRGGYLGMLGSICDLEDGRPVYYVDHQWNTYRIAENGQDFIRNIARWRENLVPAEDMILFGSKQEAEEVFDFADAALPEEV